MKLITICSMIVRASFLLALILGLGFWFTWWTPTPAIRGIHLL